MEQEARPVLEPRAGFEKRSLKEFVQGVQCFVACQRKRRLSTLTSVDESTAHLSLPSPLSSLTSQLPHPFSCS
ncbi:hypothetical protein AMELA_G00196080 [Ameiurus melas]|uniref:Uncharacterized protein n=1 Tax=Ameiurus melas TaxID=219545 RepID=A0A7J6A863_AMEME|nr:hypothetical protein AMELA_G00196080 [Ameiurus melas]